MNIICCLGDSLTEGDIGIPGSAGVCNVQPEGYPYFLEQLLPDTKTRNFGKCGFTPTQYLQHYEAGNVDLTDASAVLILLGTNGGLDPEADTQGNRDLQQLLALCRRDAPQARVILCTPTHVTENPSYSLCGYHDQVEKAVRFIRTLAAQTGTELIDTASCPAFTAEQEAVMQPNDGLHFGREGYRTLAQFIAEHLRQE